MVELSELVGQKSSSSSSVGLVAYRLLPLSLVVTSGLGLGSCLSTSRLSSTIPVVLNPCWIAVLASDLMILLGLEYKFWESCIR